MKINPASTLDQTFEGWVSECARYQTSFLIKEIVKDTRPSPAAAHGMPEVDRRLQHLFERLLRDLHSRVDISLLNSFMEWYLALVDPEKALLKHEPEFFNKFGNDLRRTIMPPPAMEFIRRMYRHFEQSSPRALAGITDQIEILYVIFRIDRQERRFARMLGAMARDSEERLCRDGDDTKDQARAKLRPFQNACHEVARPLLPRTNSPGPGGGTNVVFAAQGERSSILSKGMVVRFRGQPANEISLEDEEVFTVQFRETMDLARWRWPRWHGIRIEHDARPRAIGKIDPIFDGRSCCAAFDVSREMLHAPGYALAPWVAISAHADSSGRYVTDRALCENKLKVCQQAGVRILFTYEESAGGAERFRGRPSGDVLEVVCRSGRERPFRSLAKLLTLSHACRRATSLRPWPSRNSHRVLVLACVLLFLMAPWLGSYSVNGSRQVIRETASLKMASEQRESMKRQAELFKEQFEQSQDLEAELIASLPRGGGDLSELEERSGDDPNQLRRDSFNRFHTLAVSATHDLTHWQAIEVDQSLGTEERLEAINRLIKGKPIQPAYFYKTIAMQRKKPSAGTEAPAGDGESNEEDVLYLTFETSGLCVSHPRVFGAVGDEAPELLRTEFFRFAPETSEPDNRATGPRTIDLSQYGAKVDLRGLRIGDDQRFTLSIQAIYWNGFQDRLALGEPYDWAAMRIVNPTRYVDITGVFWDQRYREVEEFRRPRVPGRPPKRQLIRGNVCQLTIDVDEKDEREGLESDPLAGILGFTFRDARLGETRQARAVTSVVKAAAGLGLVWLYFPFVRVWRAFYSPREDE